MTAAEPQRSSPADVVQAAVAPWNLLGALWLVVKQVWPIVAGVAVLLGLFHVVYTVAPGRAGVMRSHSIDVLIVIEQLKRTDEIKSDIAFLGDSSCLFGVFVPGLPPELGHAESFCTLAYAGPEGYAKMLLHMMKVGTEPERLVLVFHPVAFRREPSWESWPKLINYDDLIMSSRVAPLVFPRTALDYLRFEVIAKAIYNPLPGIFGQYYGGEATLGSLIRTQHGSGIDPTRLRLRSLAEADAIVNSPQKPYDYSLNDPYREALTKIAPVLAQYGTERVYLAISPVPDYDFVPMDSPSARANAATEIARALGLADDHILQTPGSYPSGYFSSSTHLNRIGRLGFTRDLGAALVEATATQP